MSQEPDKSILNADIITFCRDSTHPAVQGLHLPMHPIQLPPVSFSHLQTTRPLHTHI